MKEEPSDRPASPVIPGIPSIAVRPPAARLGVIVVQQLTDAIVTGTLRPGDLLPPEPQLTSQFGVSRTVIRESVKRLEEKGLVTVVQGFGTRVTEPTRWNLLDPVVLSAMIEHDDALGILDELSKVRAVLESEMTGEAAEKATSADRENLRAIVGEMRAALDDHDTFIEADRRFHALLMDVSQNRLAPSIARTLLQRASESSRFHGRDPDDSLVRSLAFHEGILGAMAAGDAALAKRLMFDHIQGSWEARRLPLGL
ncbi:hypothetical protein B7R21_03170 [Subtercola boreus]|uniref:HTH gntR-type domain-containing protein n=1 Tax=Subtercola boreus TaxID=120213 RepID=A0A3E0W2J1_9MICO|nr:FadR/GntR family transcriptional regulator [Subtercola boreus]RFA15723.1 hypothetical protein B7R21_03170 [Subtercola boreus]